VRYNRAVRRQLAALVAASTLLSSAAIALAQDPPTGAAPTSATTGAAPTAAATAGAADAPSPARHRVRNLAALLTQAERHWPGVSAAQHKIAAAEARLQEAWVSPFFQLNATGSFAMTPGANGTPIFSPDSQLPLDNPWGPSLGIRVEGAIPLYTFGKLGAARDAARAGIHAAEEERERTRAQVRLDVRRAYFALGLALDAQQMMNEGRSKIDRAVRRLDERIAADDPEVNTMDRWRLAATLAEIEGRSSEAERLGNVSREALEVITGEDDFDVPDCPMGPVELPLRPLGWYQQAARLHRPELGMLRAGIGARDAAADAAHAQYFPDLALALTAGYTWTPGITNQSNPFIPDPANAPSLGAGIVARWSLDLYGANRRIARADQELLEVRDRLDEASAGVDIEIANVFEELRDARRREQAWGRGHRETRAWFVAAAQAYQVGTVEPRELVDAVRAYFSARFSHVQSIHDVNVATAKLERATGTDVVPADRWERACGDAAAAP